MNRLTNKISTFWKWFEQNEADLKKMFLGRKIEKLHLELIKQITNIKPGISSDIAYNDSPTIIFIISANDDESLFPIVLEIINHAPSLNGWDFIAFRPRHPRKEFTIQIDEDITISYSDLFFKRIENQEQFTAKLFINNNSDEFLLENRIPITLMLHDIIGEYDNVKNINWLSWEILTEENKEHLIPILDLIHQLDEFKNTKH